jgi:hypothetical protein
MFRPRGLRGLVALSVAVVCGLLTACSSKECTLIGCGFPFEVMLQSDPVGWSPGKYTVAVIADGAMGSCDLTFPLGSCQNAPTCTGAHDWFLGYVGCASPADQQSIRSVGFNTAPTNVELVVDRDGQRLSDSVFSPTYHSYEVNGPGCGPSCQAAPAATISIPR